MNENTNKNGIKSFNRYLKISQYCKYNRPFYRDILQLFITRTLDFVGFLASGHDQWKIALCMLIDMY